MIPSIQYPGRAADPPQSAMSPHEPEKRPRLELFANTGSLRWLRRRAARLVIARPGLRGVDSAHGRLLRQVTVSP
jgi:hypothetical protein